MAGTAVFSVEISGNSDVAKLQWLCTSDSSGNVSSPTVTTSGDKTVYNSSSTFTGSIGQVRIKPGSGTKQPSDNYVVKLNNLYDTTIDFLQGLGAACDETNTLIDTPVSSGNSIAMSLFNDSVIPFASGVGDTKQFTLTVYVWL